MNLPFYAGPRLPPEKFEEIRQRTIFECCKWDPQVEDVSVLADFPITLGARTWEQLQAWAEDLAKETIAAENELLQRPELWKLIGLPRNLQGALKEVPKPGANLHPRVMRFDFHFTTEGWKISEVNSDVPGGFIEAEGYTSLMAASYPELRRTGSPAAFLAETLAKGLPSDNQTIAMVHATGYADDRQVMEYLSKFLRELRLSPVLISPEQITWKKNIPLVNTDWFRGQPGLIFRFFPAEWLPNLSGEWKNYFSTQIPHSNPPHAILSQNKRFGLCFSFLESKLDLWKALLPEVVAPSEADWESEEWVFKPVFGRVGEGINLKGVTAEKTRKSTRRWMRFFPGEWCAQRRFRTIPLSIGENRLHLCFGVYVINGRATGIYCRGAAQPVIDCKAQDFAVLISDEHE